MTIKNPDKCQCFEKGGGENDVMESSYGKGRRGEMFREEMKGDVFHNGDRMTQSEEDQGPSQSGTQLTRAVLTNSPTTF